jgi:SAM-dependent methyltransferase
MDRRGVADHKEAVGGMWDEVGPFQLAYLRSAGLQPGHSLLDIGCGSLRGGRHLIGYLDPGRYWGTDLSPVLLRAGRRVVREEGLHHKRPHLLLARDFSFKELHGRRFEYVQAFGVFTDIPVEYVEACLGGIRTVLAPGGVFYATFAAAPIYRPDHAGKAFAYPARALAELGRKWELQVEVVDGFSRTHPKGHSLLRVRPADEGHVPDAQRLQVASQRYAGFPKRGATQIEV